MGGGEPGGGGQLKPMMTSRTRAPHERERNETPPAVVRLTGRRSQIVGARDQCRRRGSTWGDFNMSTRDTFQRGDRVRWSAEWLDRHPDESFPDRLGTVVGYQRMSPQNCVWVQWDGNKSRLSIHMDFLMKDQS